MDDSQRRPRNFAPAPDEAAEVSTESAASRRKPGRSGSSSAQALAFTFVNQSDGGDTRLAVANFAGLAAGQN